MPNPTKRSRGRGTGAVLGGLGLGACTLAANLPIWAALSLTAVGFVGCHLLFKPKPEAALPSLEDVFEKHQRELLALANALPPPLDQQVRNLQAGIRDLQDQFKHCPPDLYAQGLTLLASLENVLAALHQFQALAHRLGGQQGEVAASVSSIITNFSDNVRSFNKGLLQADVDKLNMELQIVQRTINEIA